MFCTRNFRLLNPFYSKFYSTNHMKWDVMVGICLQRKPLITKPLNDIEKKFQKILHEIEYERSLKSDHELRHEKDLLRMEKLKTGKVDDLDIEQAVNQSAQDFVDINKNELVKFKFASCLTEADKENDYKSLNRKLEQNLILILKQNFGCEGIWILPQGKWKSGETLRQAAERVLQNLCGETIRARFYGNAPCGFYKYKYPKEKQQQSNIQGAKIFFYKTALLGGNLENISLRDDYEWATEEELSKKFVQPYTKSVKLFLSNNMV
ncbi:39S ribosomal protein L46, mitochondrial [Daktulosphaira vitifoliae]|uniref:39S ribosomal protein L46, mitochondrial n=1 Tax=Daktulosphaira vitifoliae TaxID=58002 RepID=UPI0021AA6ABB|nr:39S ribosomal protein L46, mitochondrial [Daktulosphaira vitifoliae]